MSNRDKNNSISMTPLSQWHSSAGHRFRAYRMAADVSDLRGSFSSAARSHSSRSSSNSRGGGGGRAAPPGGGGGGEGGGPARVGWFAAEIGLDQVQFGDAAQHLCRERRRSHHVQVVELATRVRPTCRFVDPADFVQGVEPA
jgi:hypothetical protein